MRKYLVRCTAVFHLLKNNKKNEVEHITALQKTETGTADVGSLFFFIPTAIFCQQQHSHINDMGLSTIA